MSMTLAESVANLDLLLDIDLDNFNGLSASNQSKADALWEETKLVYPEAQVYFDTVAFSPAENDYQFELKHSQSKIGAVMRRIDDVWIDDLKIKMYSWADFDRLISWRTATKGKPYGWAMSPARKLVFDKPFDADTVAAAGFNISGWGYPRKFDYGTDSGNEWVVQELLRWAVIKRTAYKLASPFARNSGAIATIQRYLAEAMVDIALYSEEQSDRTSPLEGDLESPVCDRIGF